MKLTSLLCTTLATLSLACVGLQAQQTNAAPGSVPPPPPPGGGEHHMKMDYLTPDEQAKLEAARKKAIESDPSLKADMEAMKQEHKTMKDAGTRPTPEQRKEMAAKRKAFEDKLDAATIKADPSVAPILEKVKAHRQEMMQKMMERRSEKKNATQSSTTSTAQ